MIHSRFDLLNLYKAIFDSNRKNRNLIWRNLGLAVSGLPPERTLSFSDMRELCDDPRSFTRAPINHLTLYRRLTTLNGLDQNDPEFSLWIEMLRFKLQAEEVEKTTRHTDGTLKTEMVTVTRSTRKIMEIIRRDQFLILRQTYDEIPKEVFKRFVEAFLKKQSEKIRKREQQKLAEERIEQARQLAEEHQLLIRRGELPDRRIEELNLPLPRVPADDIDFENICRDWLEAWGDFNAVVTQVTGDGGIDVESTNCVAQAKFFASGKVGRPALQQLAGAASISGKIKVFFAYGDYTNEAIEYANHENVLICLFKFNIKTFRFDPINSLGQWLVSSLAELHLPNPDSQPN
jgi:hypothetical protein